MDTLLLATERGLVTCDRDGEGWRIALHSLADHRLTCAAGQGDLILAGTTNGIFRSADAGQTWHEAGRGLTARHIRWMAWHPEIDGLALAGTEPANIFVSRDGGAAWRACPEVAELRDRFRWSLPYSPEAGCVRGFAFHSPRIYAAVEVGGVLVSDDRGETWRLAEGSDGQPGLQSPPEPFIYPDVHSLEVHPSSAELVYAPTGGGFYRSRDGGQTWKLLYECYCRAVWADPADPEHLVLGPADGVDRNGRIEESRDGGQTWSPASSGLQVPWRRGMVERFHQAGDELLAVLSNGEVLIAPLATLAWKRIAPQSGHVNAIGRLQR